MDKCSKLAQKREGGVKKRPENAHMINERSQIRLAPEQNPVEPHEGKLFLLS